MKRETLLEYIAGRLEKVARPHPIRMAIDGVDGVEPCDERDHAGAVPVRVHVSAAIPQIDIPTEAIDRLAAYAADSPT